jgi:hypothetical protein
MRACGDEFGGFKGDGGFARRRRSLCSSACHSSCRFRH